MSKRPDPASQNPRAQRRGLLISRASIARLKSGDLSPELPTLATSARVGTNRSEARAGTSEEAWEADWERPRSNEARADDAGGMG